MNSELKQKLIKLSQKYETSEFLKKDPSQFMHRFTQAQDQETAAFFAANLAFGRRDQILSHVELILSEMQESGYKSPSEWVKSGDYEKLFTVSDASYYRMYTFTDLRLFSDTLRKLLLESESHFDGTIGSVLEEKYSDYVKTFGFENKGNTHGKSENEKSVYEKPYPAPFIASLFPPECKILPHTKDGAAKKVNMLLRWMVRDNSPVDLGLWKWYSKADLLMPLDTHVIQEASSFGIFPLSKTGKIKSPSLKTAVELTQTLAEAFPGDPVRGDFALFGLGADKA